MEHIGLEPMTSCVPRFPRDSTITDYFIKALI